MCPGRSSLATSAHPFGKRIVEALAGQVYGMELDIAHGYRGWAYCKAARAIKRFDAGLVYRQMGRKGLESIENNQSRPEGKIGQMATAKLATWPMGVRNSWDLGGVCRLESKNEGERKWNPFAIAAK